jgi:hypothetical protein
VHDLEESRRQRTEGLTLADLLPRAEEEGEGERERERARPVAVATATELPRKTAERDA